MCEWSPTQQAPAGSSDFSGVPSTETIGNGDMIVRVPLWTNFVISVRTRILITLAVLGWFATSLLLVVIWGIGGFHSDDATNQLKKIDQVQRFAEVVRATIAAERRRIAEGLKLADFSGAEDIPESAWGCLDELRRYQADLQLFDHVYVRLARELETSPPRDCNSQAAYNERLNDAVTTEHGTVTLEATLDKIRRAREDLDRALSNARLWSQRIADNRAALIRKIDEVVQPLRKWRSKLAQPPSSPRDEDVDEALTRLSELDRQLALLETAFLGLQRELEASLLADDDGRREFAKRIDALIVGKPDSKPLDELLSDVAEAYCDCSQAVERAKVNKREIAARTDALRERLDRATQTTNMWRQKLTEPYVGPHDAELDEMASRLADYAEQLTSLAGDLERFSRELDTSPPQTVAGMDELTERMDTRLGSEPREQILKDLLGKVATARDAFESHALVIQQAESTAVLERQARLLKRACALGVRIAALMDTAFVGYEVNSADFNKEMSELLILRGELTDYTRSVEAVLQSLSASFPTVATEYEPAELQLTRLETEFDERESNLRTALVTRVGSLVEKGKAARRAFDERTRLLRRAQWIAYWRFWGTSLSGESHFLSFDALAQKYGLSVEMLRNYNRQKVTRRTIYSVQACSPESYDRAYQGFGGWSYRARWELSIPDDIAELILDRMRWQNKHVFLYTRTEGHYQEKRQEMTEVLVHELNHCLPGLGLTANEVSMQWTPGNTREIIMRNMRAGILTSIRIPDQPRRRIDR